MSPSHLEVVFFSYLPVRRHAGCAIVTAYPNTSIEAMTIELFKNHGIPYLRLVESRGIERIGTKVVQRRKTVLSIGPLSRHDDGKPGYLLRLRQSFRDGRPLIKSLEPFVGAAPRRDVLVPFREGDARCLGEPKRMAAAILDGVFAALGLDELFASVKFASRIKYDLAGVVRLLVYGRLLDPASKRSTMEQNGEWFRPLADADGSYRGCVYDALDVICANSARIIRRMDTCIRRAARQGARGLAGGRASKGIPADAERHRRRHQDGAGGVRHRDPAPALHERRRP